MFQKITCRRKLGIGGVAGAALLWLTTAIGQTFFQDGFEPLAARFSLSCGSQALGSIVAPGDVDRIEFVGREDQLITLSVVVTGGFSPSTARLRLLSPAGSRIGDILNAAGQRQVVLPADGIYTVEVEARDGNSNGLYAVGLSCPQEPGAVLPELVCGGLLTGSIIAPAEVDLLHLDGVQGQTVTLTVAKGADFEPSGSARLRLIAPSGSLTVTALDSNRQQQLILPETGRYTVHLQGADLRATGSYVVGLSCPFERTGSEPALRCGSIVTGTIVTPGEVDQLTLTGRQGDRYTLTWTDSEGFSIYGARLRLLSPQGVQIIPGLNSNAQQQVTLPQDGTYVIQAQAANLTSPGTYALGLACPSQPAGDTPVLACGVTVAGRIDAPAEVDQLQFAGTAGQEVVVAIRKRDGFGITGAARLRVFSPTGFPTVASLDSNNQQPVTLLESGIHVVQVAASTLVSSGSYEVSLMCP